MKKFSREDDEMEKETLVRIFERAMRLDRAGPFDQMGRLARAYIWLHWDLWFQRVRPMPTRVSGAVAAALPSEESLKKAQMLVSICAGIIAILTWLLAVVPKLLP